MRIWSLAALEEIRLTCMTSSTNASKTLIPGLLAGALSFVTIPSLGLEIQVLSDRARLWSGISGLGNLRQQRGFHVRAFQTAPGVQEVKPNELKAQA